MIRGARRFSSRLPDAHNADFDIFSHLARTVRKAAKVRMPTSATGNHPLAARCRAAFTLVELLVALALLAVAAGIIVPRMSRSMGRSELREAVGRFAYTAKAARQYAMARRQACAMEINLDAGTYGVTVPSGKSRTSSSQVVQASWLKVGRWPATLRVAAYQTPDGQASVSGTQRLDFLPDGTTSGASIRLAHETDEYQVIVHPHSGQVVFGDASTTTFTEDQYELGD